jgi:hypothetical protein
MLDFIPTAHLMYLCGIFGVLSAGLFFAAVGAKQRKAEARVRSMANHPAGRDRV